jgi:hypothetical protein
MITTERALKLGAAALGDTKRVAAQVGDVGMVAEVHEAQDMLLNLAEQHAVRPPAAPVMPALESDKPLIPVVATKLAHA